MMPSAAALDAPAFVSGLSARTGAGLPKLCPDVREEEGISDEALFERASKGDREALGGLIGRYEDFLYALLVRLCGDAHRAEDIFQDTFLNAMRAAATFDRKKAFKPWITAIAVNLVRDDARRRKVRSEVALDPVGPDGESQSIDPVAEVEDPGDRAERRDEDEKVRRALERLTDLEREVVLLHFYNDMTLQQTAGALNAPLGTIKSRLHAALTRLSGLLGRGAGTAGTKGAE